MIVSYVNDCIILSRTKEEANKVFKELDDKQYTMVNEGTMEEYLGILMTHNKDGTYIMSQPHLIDTIVNLVPSIKDARSANTLVVAGVVLTKDVEGGKR